MQSVQFDTRYDMWVCLCLCELADSEVLTYCKKLKPRTPDFVCSKRLGCSTDGRHRALAAGIKLVKGCNTVAMTTIEWSVGYGLDSWRIVCLLAEGRDCMFCTIQRNLRAIRPPIQWVLATCLSRIKWRGVRLTASAAVVKNECRHTYSHPLPLGNLPSCSRQVKYNVQTNHKDQYAINQSISIPKNLSSLPVQILDCLHMKH
jgi:hypothetical protein